jgi:FKBP-type peptidyl-prolyl cis-trans isomerase 2
MVSDTKRLCRILPVVVAAALILLLPVYSHSEGQVVKAGDEAAVHFTCRLPNGDIAASSYGSVAENSALKKSPVFWHRTVNTPIAIMAGSPSVPDDAGVQRSLEDEILYRLAGAIVGLRTGEGKTVEVRSERRPEKNKDEYLLKAARVRQRMKEMSLSPEQYTARMGKTAEVGQPFVLDPAVPGKVASVTEKEVVIRFSAKAGEKVATPLGEGTVRELPDRYEIAIDAHPGALVRSGGYVGRILSVDDRLITIDYGHPFGGEALLCDVLVESAKAGAK